MLSVHSLLLLLLLFFTPPAFAQDTGAADAGGDGGVAEVTAETLTEQQIEASFDRLETLVDVDVTFGAGVATLTGSVDTTEQRQIAEDIASRIDGVLWVDNQLAVADTAKPSEDPSVRDSAIRERLENVFANVDELSDVNVEVRSGVVRLEGTVLTSATIEKAEELAARQEGVVYVDNSLEQERAVGERISPAIKKARAVSEEFLSTLPLFAVGVLILVLFYFFAGFVARLDFPYRRLGDKPLVQGIVRQAVRLVIVGIGFVLVLELFDLTALVGAVLGTAGVAGLALGFAFKEIVENYLSSVMLSMRQPFQKDDVVEVGDLEGKVVRLTTRDTVLMTLDGNHLRVPNSTVFKSVITNYTRNPLRRFQFVVGVGVGEDLKECVRIGNETLLATSGVLEEPKAFGLVEELGDFTVNLRFYGWVEQTEHDFLSVKSEAIRRVKVAFDQASIDMPEPVQRVLNADFTPPPPKDVPPLEEDRPEPDEDRPTEQVDEAIKKDREGTDEPDLLTD